MAWNTGTLTPAVGELISALDTYLVGDFPDTWSIYDSGYATNEKVYQCYDDTQDPVYEFYMRVQDNQAAYAIIELYDHWDNVAHDRGLETNVFIKYGDSATYYPYIRKAAGGYAIRTHAHHFVFIENNRSLVNFCGFLIKPDSASGRIVPGIPMLFCNSTNATVYNPIGYGYQNSTYTVCSALYGPARIPCALGTGGDVGTGVTSYMNDFNGVLWVKESFMLPDTIRGILGKLPGIMSLRDDVVNKPFATNNSISVGDDVWMYYKSSGNFQCLVQMNY